MSSDRNGSSERITTLVLRAQDGDIDSFEQLVDTYQAPLLRLAFRILGNRADAEDVAQESLMNALGQARPPGDPAGLPDVALPAGGEQVQGHPQVASTRFHGSDRRSSRRKPRVDGYSGVLGSQRAAENRSGMDALSAMLQKLPAEQRAC
jgi:RNA polymerase sigma-70 factor (ECF subfamily)